MQALKIAHQHLHQTDVGSWTDKKREIHPKEIKFIPE